MGFMASSKIQGFHEKFQQSHGSKRQAICHVVMENSVAMSSSWMVNFWWLMVEKP
jgi:hypothetical protein